MNNTSHGGSDWLARIGGWLGGAVAACVALLFAYDVLATFLS